MTAKEYLDRYRKLTSYIDCKYEEIRQLRERATRLTPSAMFDRNGDISDRVGRTAARIADLERDICGSITEAAKLQAEITDVINSIDDYDMRTMLTYRYINGWSWRKIAAKMNYSEKHITGYLHRKALQKVEKLIPHDTFSVL